MKSRILILSFLLVFVNGFSLPHISGIYLAVTDYIDKKLAYASECSTDNETIKLNEFFNKSYIIIGHHGNKYKLKKSEIFGYKDCNEREYRFYKNNEFEIAESRKMVIYATTQDVPNTKGFTIAHLYYFSTALDGKIMALTIENLKNTYPDNYKLIDMLDSYFKDDHIISEYDAFNKMYKVNYLLEVSLQR